MWAWILVLNSAQSADFWAAASTSVCASSAELFFRVWYMVAPNPRTPPPPMMRVMIWVKSKRHRPGSARASRCLSRCTSRLRFHHRRERPMANAVTVRACVALVWVSGTCAQMFAEIGRASCRERVEVVVDGGGGGGEGLNEGADGRGQRAGQGR